MQAYQKRNCNFEPKAFSIVLVSVTVMQTYTQALSLKVAKLLSKNSSLSDDLQVEQKPLFNKGDLTKLDQITEVDIS